MSNKDDEEWVEKLLRNLPKAPEMSPLEVKRFEKHVELLVAKEKKRQRIRRWTPQVSIAASVIILFAGFALFTNDSGILDDPATIVSPGKDPISPNPTNSEDNNSQSDEVDQQNSDSQKPKTEIGEYDAGKSPKPNSSKKTVPVLRSGIDYEANLDLVRSQVLPSVSDGSLKNLSSAQIACSVELGVKDSLFAIDRGIYAGESIDAYFFGSSKTDLKIKIVSYGCKFLVELDLSN